jgi:carbonic anhydrase
MTADEALARLIEGNRRFAANRAIHPNTSENRRLEVRDLQRPFAIILGCADSRVPPKSFLTVGWVICLSCARQVM